MNRLQIPFFKRFTIFGGVMFIVVILVANLYYAHQTSNVLRQRLQEKAVFINGFLAYTFSSALALKDDVTLIQVIDQLVKDRDILNIVVSDDQGQIRYSVDQNKIGDDIDDQDMKQVFKSGEPVMRPYTNAAGDAMELVAPLKIQGHVKPMGVVRLDLTFKSVTEKMRHARDSFLMFAIGMFTLGMTLSNIALQNWVARPIHTLKNYLRTIGPENPDAHLPEGQDDLGQLNASINEMILKFQSQIQNQAMLQAGQVTQDVGLIQQLLCSLMPDARILMADRYNRLISDTDMGSGLVGGHILDLLDDVAFATLVAAAFQSEGQSFTGPIVLHEVPLHATIIRLPESFSKQVRTLILLTKNKESVTP